MSHSSVFNSKSLLSVVKTESYHIVKSYLGKHGLAQSHNENCLALIEAVQKRNYDIVKLLLSYQCLAEETKADIFYKSVDHAIEDIRMLKILLQGGASIAGKDFKGKTPLIRAMQKRVYSAVDTMLSMYNINSIDPTNKNDVIHFSIACARNSILLVDHFIQKGMNINIILDNYFDEWVGCTPLYLAVINLSVEVVEKLLSYGVNIVVKNQYEFTPLHNAYNIWQRQSRVDHKNKASYIIDLFLSAHKSIATNPVDFNGISHFYIACVRNNAMMVKSFLLGGVDLKKETVSLLCNVVRLNCFEVVNVLLNHGLTVDSKDSEGNTALHVSLDHRFYGIAELLVKYHANVQIADKNGYSPIHKVFFRMPECEKLLDLMLSVCNDKLNNVKCPGNLSLFHIACARSNTKLVKDFMSECYIDMNEQVKETFLINNFNCDGFTALHFAVCAQNLQIIELLLKSNADVNVTDVRGVTALWYALDSQPKYYNVSEYIIENFADELTNNNNMLVEKNIIDSLFDHFNHIEIVELLLKSESDLNYKNVCGYPLLFKAYQSSVTSLTNKNIDYGKEDLVSKICYRYFFNNSKKIMELLISHGINRNPRDSRMNSIFHFLIDSLISHDHITEIAIEVADLLIGNGGNPTLVDQYGDSPLFMAIKNRSIHFVKLLLKYNTDINSLDRNLMTPLHIAMQCPWNWVPEYKYNSYINMIQFLLSNGSAVDARDIDGQTPLFKALDSELSLKAIELLLDQNCDVNAQDKYGRTALSVAATKDNPEAVKILLKYGADINIKDNYNNSLLKQISLSNNDIKRVLEVIAVHVYKLILIGYHVSFENLGNCGHPNLVESTTISALREELDVLKKSKVDQYTFLYDILFKSIQQMTRHVKNETLEDLVNSNVISNHFPHYGYIINLKYRQAKTRIQILKRAEQSLRLLGKGELLPDSCIDSIFSYMTNKDLENLSCIQK